MYKESIPEENGYSEKFCVSEVKTVFDAACILSLKERVWRIIGRFSSELALKYFHMFISTEVESIIDGSSR